MREIKFRAWSRGRKEMAEVESIHFKGNVVYLISKYLRLVAYLDETELMQFTGSYDDNKKEIYVGDIMLCDTEDGPCLYQIKFGTTSDDNILTSFYFDFIRSLDCYVDSSNPDENDGNEKDIELYTKYNPEDKSFIVIGNIYQNPELLEVGEY